MATVNAHAGLGRRGLARAAATRAEIDHPNLLGARLAPGPDSRVSLRLESCSAPTLAQVLSRRKLSPRGAVRMVHDIASAVTVLSVHGLVARDLTPRKIRLDPEYGAILADHGLPFELAPRRPSEARRDLAYRSPEELEGGTVDARSSVYSLGAILYTALTGSTPPRSGTGWRSARASDGLPRRLAAVVERAMARGPAQRYADVRELSRAATAALRLDGAPSTAARRRPPRPLGAAPAKAPTRRASTEPRSKPSQQQPRSKPRPNLEPKPPVEPTPKAAAAPPPRASEPRPQVKRPGVKLPQVKRPGVKLPQIKLPQIKLPQIKRPDVKLPRAKRPDVHLPQVKLPQVKLPQVKLPQVKLSRPDLPELPRLRAPDLSRLNLPDAPGLPRPAVLATLAALLACAIAGILLGRSTGEEAQASQIKSRALTVPLPNGWEPAEALRDPAVNLSGAVAAAPSGVEATGLVVGRVSDTVAFDRRVRGEIAPDNVRTEVQLGRLQAWRYEGLTLRRDLVATAYLAPTTGGSLLILCHAGPREAATYLPECERMAATITLRGERPLPLSEVDSRDEHLESAMTSLSRDRRAARQRLARAELADGQAGVARDLQRAYDRTAQRVEGILTTDGSAAYEELVGALTATADAYGELAAAAAETDRSRYQAAIEAVREREEAVHRVAVDPDAG
jgi:serine/threonine protein kinase